METGSVTLNDVSVIYGVPEAPFGGVKASGTGRVNGIDGLLGYCNLLPIIGGRFGNRKLSGSYPHTRNKLRHLKQAIGFFWGSRLGRWFQ